MQKNYKNSIYVSIILTILVVIYLMAFKIPSIKQRIDNYAISKMEAKFGSALLVPAQEAKILATAQEMGIAEPIVIRKMNTWALQKFGYHNAFACWADLWELIPFSNQPFMFFSEGFLEDLSEAEQRFLIGHELIHVRDRHVMFFKITWLFGILFLVGLTYLAQRYVKQRFEIKPVALYLLTSAGIYFSLAIPNLVGLAYRRYIEKVADCESFRLLNSHEGCLKLIERWQADFKMPKHDAYYGLLSDHPSCFERKCYCLDHQKSIKVIK